MLWANRNGFFYALDRTNGQFLSGHPFVKVNWASGLDDDGRPLITPQPPGAPVYPGVQGGTNWYSPSYSPRTGLFYVSAWEDYASIFVSEEVEYQPGQHFTGGRPTSPIPGAPNPGLRGGPDQQLDRSHGARLGDGARHPHRPEEVEVRYDGCDRCRNSDDGLGPVVHRRARRILSRPGCPDRRAAVEGQRRRPGFRRAHYLFRSTESSTSRSPRATPCSSTDCANKRGYRVLRNARSEALSSGASFNPYSWPGTARCSTW